MIIKTTSLLYLAHIFIAAGNIPTASASRASSSYTSEAEFRDTILKVTNQYRSEHHVDDLKWNGTLTHIAWRWAKKCGWKNSPYEREENIATDFPDVSAAVKSWGDERDKYDFDKPTGFSEDTKHFTQLVWKDTTSVGCARVYCGNRRGWDHDHYNDHDDDDDDDKDDKDDDKDDDDDDDEDDRNDKRDIGRRGDRGYRYDDSYGWYVVCEYSPPGNVAGKDQFEKNVQPRDRNGGGGRERGGSSSTRGNEGDANETGNAVRLAGHTGWGAAITLSVMCFGMFGLA